VPDRELARDVARVNLSAKELGEGPLITREVVDRLKPAGLREAIDKAPDLGALRAALTPSRLFFSRTIEPPRGFGPER
jgi:hypothetical protein